MEELADAFLFFIEHECEDLMLEDVHIERGDDYIRIAVDGCFSFTDYSDYDEPDETQGLANLIARASSVEMGRGAKETLLALTFRDE